VNPTLPPAHLEPAPLVAPAVATPTDTGTLAPPPAPPTPEPPAPNVIRLELLGNGLLYSINYERLFPAWNLGLRVGASFFMDKISNAAGAGNLVLASVPLVASYFLGTPRHKLELGLGATILYSEAATDSTGTKYEGSVTGLGVAATGVVGYRFLPAGRGFTLGAGFTPLLRATKGFLPWGGVSAGYAF
jgi:hypothetical protein